MIFNKLKLDLEFVDVSKSAYLKTPIKLAKEISPAFTETQKQASGKFVFANCPGMTDYAQLGYIIPAWVDMRIIANKAGVRAFIGSQNRGSHGFDQPTKMEANMVNGIFNTEDGIPLEALKFVSPWKIFTTKNISALLLPAVFHSTFLDDLYVYPGIVDYKDFHVTNFICSPKRKCEIEIKAGDPLLHVIPFVNTEIKAGYGPASAEQIDTCRNEIISDDNQFYRKFLRYTKSFKLFS
jgi:hypothetical protein